MIIVIFNGAAIFTILQANIKKEKCASKKTVGFALTAEEATATKINASPFHCTIYK